MLYIEQKHCNKVQKLIDVDYTRVFDIIALNFDRNAFGACAAAAFTLIIAGMEDKMRKPFYLITVNGHVRSFEAMC